jgi:hypothetical protein
MCTVSFVPSGNRFFFTSSRDERVERPLAVFPKLYERNGRKILYPLDPKGGGSWIAVNESGHLVVLLNGAVKPHQPVANYRMSRGLVVLDLISQLSILEAFEIYDCSEIEPFTLILFEEKNLWCGRWDGKMKWLEALSSHKPQIWSSITLYSPEIISQREVWFREWISSHAHPGVLDIIRFHQKAGNGDPRNSILMNRDDQLFTNSISVVSLSPETASFRYLDLRNKETTESFLTLQKSIYLNI